MKEEIKSRVEDIKSKLRAQNQLLQEAKDSLQKANERLNETKESIKNDLQSEYRNREHFSVLSPLKEQGERSGVRTARMFLADNLHIDESDVELRQLRAMKKYATQVAEAVRQKCLGIVYDSQTDAEAKQYITEINISQFIK